MEKNSNILYFDYSATTPTNKDVLDIFNMVSLNFIGNPNSHHKLGIQANNLVNNSTDEISKLLSVLPNEVIYTSGASESNNMAIKGITTYEGKHIITTRFEHPSIYGPITYLEKNGYEVDFVKTNEKGMVDLDDLKSLLKDDTVLVTIASVNSEIGLKQPIKEIGELLLNYPNCVFHVDITQSIGKENISLENIDLASISAHKFFGIKGIGLLVKKENIKLEPLIHGGKSTTAFRSGTPAPALICSLAEALRIAYEELDLKYKRVEKWNNYLQDKLSNYEKVRINSNEYSIPHILNISILGTNPTKFQEALEEHKVYVSTQTACHTGSDVSLSVMALTKDEERAKSSIRISLSYVTTQDELDKFLIAFDECYKKMVNS